MLDPEPLFHRPCVSLLLLSPPSPIPGLEFLWRVALECNRPGASKRSAHEDAFDQLLKLYGNPLEDADRPRFIAAFVK